MSRCLSTALLVAAGLGPWTWGSAGCSGGDKAGPSTNPPGGTGGGVAPSGSGGGVTPSGSGGGVAPSGSGGSGSSGSGGAPADAGAAGTGGASPMPGQGPAAGNPNGHCAVPPEAAAEDSSHPTTVVGTGTPASCTGAAFVDAVAKGGVITFDCGPDPATITLTATAKVFNDTTPKIVIDGGGKITLDGGGHVRILYQDTCDANQHYTSPHCQDQDTPQLTVQNLTFANGNAKGETFDGGGGGAIFVRGGRFKVVGSRFFNNVCDDTGQDVGGAAIRVLSQSMNQPVYVVSCTFGGAEGLGNNCSNGGGLSSIGVSYTVLNSLFSYNNAIGHGANPARAGTPGGGNGGAIYNDGDTYTLTICGADINHNSANEGGGAIIFVSDDLSGSLIIHDSTLSANPSAGFETAGLPGIFVQAKGPPDVTGSTITK